MVSTQNVQPNQNKRWSDTERRFISTHRKDGYVLISEGLRGFGRDRTPDAVRMYALRRMGLTLAKWPEDGMRKCVQCGNWYARPNTTAGREGYCPTCWKRRQTEALREGRAERAANLEYDSTKHAILRERRRGR